MDKVLMNESLQIDENGNLIFFLDTPQEKGVYNVSGVVEIPMPTFNERDRPNILCLLLTA